MHIHCKSCGETIHSDDVNLDRAIAKCRGCHAVFGFADQVRNAVEPGTGERRREVVPMPERIRVEREGGDLLIARRWFTAAAIPLVFFCIFWDGFLVFWYFIAFTKSSPLIMKLFPLLHVAVGVGLTYYTVTLFFNTTSIRIRRGELAVEHSPLPWPGNRVIPTDDIRQLYCTEHIGQNRRGGNPATYRVNVALKAGEKVKLLEGLTEADQALFIEQEIEQYLGIEDKPVPGELQK